MGVYNFLFGKTTYKGDNHLIGSGLTEEKVELPAFRGRCQIYFDEEGAKGIGLELPPGTYRFALTADFEEEFFSDLTINGTEEGVYLPLSVELINKAELIISRGEDAERIPLW